MKPTADNSAMRSDPPQAPLARDPDGKPFALPDGAAYWRVRRQTGGRPKAVRGVDRQPLRVPLDMTMDELEDILGPSTYWLDLCDQASNLLNVTVPITIRGPGVADDKAVERDDEASPPTSAVSTTLPSTSNEVRLVLEANVRAMQASFQHNQRTLEISLRMADTLRDGVRVLADAQADWIKSLASSKGYLRNAAVAAAALPPPAAAAANDDNDLDTEEGERDDEEPAEPKHWAEIWAEKLTPYAAPLAVQLAQQFTSRPSTKGSAATAGAPAKETDGFLDKARDLFDWRRAAEKGAAKRAKDANPKPTGPGGLMALVADAPPEVVAKVMSVAQSLTAAERDSLMQLMSALDPEDIPAVVAELRELSNDELLARLRTLAASTAAASASPAE